MLLVHPAVHDFACHDFWLKPYGLLKLAGLLHQNGVEVYYFDFLDRYAYDVENRYRKSDSFGKGKFPRHFIAKPDFFQHVPRRFKRYGRKIEVFEQFLKTLPPLDAVFITCTMTYWYPGIKELLPYLSGVPVYLGGGYASLLPEHARSLGVQVVTHDSLPEFLSKFGLNLEGFYSALPYWDGYPYLPYVVTRLSWGCPCQCTYCAVQTFYPRFINRDIDNVYEEIAHSLREETTEVVFYDDALLVQSEELFLLCKKILSMKKVRFHTPNGLAVKHLTRGISRSLKDLHFGQIYLGYETGEDKLQVRMGGKTSAKAFEKAVEALRKSSYALENVHAYILMGHDLVPPDTVERSIQHVVNEGIHPLLAEYSPIPGTPDGNRVFNRATDPILTNKTSWTYKWAPPDVIRNLKDLAHGNIA